MCVICKRVDRLIPNNRLKWDGGVDKTLIHGVVTRPDVCFDYTISAAVYLYNSPHTQYYLSSYKTYYAYFKNLKYSFSPSFDRNTFYFSVEFRRNCMLILIGKDKIKIKSISSIKTTATAVCSNFSARQDLNRVMTWYTEII